MKSIVWSSLAFIFLPLIADAQAPICSPHKQQLANRESLASSSTFAKPYNPDYMPKLPAVGSGPYCDPLYGFPVTRVDNPSLVANNGTITSGIQVTLQDAYANPSVGFSRDGSKLQLLGFMGTNGIYTLDTATLRVTKAEAFFAYPSWDGQVAPPEDGSDGGLGNVTTNGLGFGLTGGGVWHPENSNKMIALRGMFLYSVDLGSKMPAQNNAHPAVPLADLRSLFDWNQRTVPGQSGCPSADQCFVQRYPSLGDVSLVQCYSSANLKTWACTTYVRNLVGVQATSYVVFRLRSLDLPVDTNRQVRANAAKTNWEVLRWFVNGIDTSSPDVFRTIKMYNSDTHAVEARGLQNPYNGGYKVSLDPSGRFLYFSGSRPPDQPTLNPLPFVYDLTRPLNNGSDDASFALINDLSGHSAVGSGTLISMDYESPLGIRKWDLAGLIYNDLSLTVNIGVPFTSMPGGIELSDYLALPAIDSTLVAYSGPPEIGNPAYANEIRVITTNPITGARIITRVAYVNSAIPTGWGTKIDLRQPMVSPNGDLIAFSTNFGNTSEQPFDDRAGASYVMVVRIK